MKKNMKYIVGILVLTLLLSVSPALARSASETGSGADGLRMRFVASVSEQRAESVANRLAYTQTNLVSDVTGSAIDLNLVNSGIVHSPNGWFVSDNGTGLATYKKDWITLALKPKPTPTPTPTVTPTPTPTPIPTATTFQLAISTQFSYGEAIQQTSDGGYVTGSNFCSNSICYLALVAKIDSKGNIQWQKQYQVNGFSTQLYALRQTSDGGYIWAGDIQNQSSSSCSECGLVTKLDSSGNIQWQKSYSNAEHANDIQQTSDGGYIIAGYTPPGNTVSTYFTQGWIAKLDSSGNVQWEQTLASSGVNVAGNSVQQTKDGGYVLTGYSGSPPTILVAKFDSSGNIKWKTIYNAPVPTGSIGGQVGYSVIQSSDGGYIVAGQVNTQSALALKLDSSGNVLWAKTYSESGTSSQFNSVRQTNDGGYVFAGYYYSSATYGGYNSWIVRTDSGGNVQWQKTYGDTTQSREFQRVDLTSDGGFVAIGWTLQFSPNNQAYIVRTDSNGDVNNCNYVQSTTATTTSVPVTTSSANISIGTPTNGTVSGMATVASTSFSTTRGC